MKKEVSTSVRDLSAIILSKGILEGDIIPRVLEAHNALHYLRSEIINVLH